MLLYGDPDTYERSGQTMFSIRLGVCHVSGASDAHWANVKDGITIHAKRNVLWFAPVIPQATHSCPEDHIASWPQPFLRWEILLPQHSAVLSFSLGFNVCPMNESGRTLVMKLSEACSILGTSQSTVWARDASDSSHAVPNSPGTSPH